MLLEIVEEEVLDPWGLVVDGTCRCAASDEDQDEQGCPPEEEGRVDTVEVERVRRAGGLTSRQLAARLRPMVSLETSSRDSRTMSRQLPVLKGRVRRVLRMPASPGREPKESLFLPAESAFLSPSIAVAMGSTVSLCLEFDLECFAWWRSP